MIGIGPRDDDFAAVAAVPCRNTMPPPQLARDAPVSNVVHPLEVRLRPIGGNEFRPFLLYCRNRRFCQRLDLHEPLRRKQRFHDRMAALAVPDVVREWLSPRKETLSFKIVQHAFPSLGSVQSLIWTTV